MAKQQSNRVLAYKAAKYDGQILEVQKRSEAAAIKHRGQGGCVHTALLAESLVPVLEGARGVIMKRRDAGEWLGKLHWERFEGGRPSSSSSRGWRAGRAADILSWLGCDYEAALHALAYSEIPRPDVSMYGRMAGSLGATLETNLHRWHKGEIPDRAAACNIILWLHHGVLSCVDAAIRDSDPSTHGWPDYGELIEEWAQRSANAISKVMAVSRSAVVGPVGYGCVAPAAGCDCEIHSDISQAKLALSAAKTGSGSWWSSKVSFECDCGRDVCMHAKMVQSHGSNSAAGIYVGGKIFPLNFMPHLYGAMADVNRFGRWKISLDIPAELETAIVRRGVRDEYGAHIPDHWMQIPQSCLSERSCSDEWAGAVCALAPAVGKDIDSLS